MIIFRRRTAFHRVEYWELFFLICGETPNIVKSKAVPLQAWSGPEGSRKLRFSDYVTMTQNGGKVVSLTHRPFLPAGNTPGTHLF